MKVTADLTGKQSDRKERAYLAFSPCHLIVWELWQVSACCAGLGLLICEEKVSGSLLEQ